MRRQIDRFEIRSTLGPPVAIGPVVIRNKQILRVKRKKEPGRGLWAIPVGTVLLGEILQKAAEREVLP